MRDQAGVIRQASRRKLYIRFREPLNNSIRKLSMSVPSNLPVWQELKAHHAAIADLHLRDCSPPIPNAFTGFPGGSAICWSIFPSTASPEKRSVC
jgi:hypothetical protein